MAYFEKRANGWRAQIRRKGYPSISATFPTRSEAERWAAEIEGDMSRARFVDTREAQQTTLGDALLRYRREITDFKKGAAQERSEERRVGKECRAAWTREEAKNRRRDRTMRRGGQQT